MFYPDDIIEEVRLHSDIVDVVGQAVKLKRSGSGYKGLCPFHNEKTPSFSVVPSKQIYHCFGCGAGGDVFSFLMEYDNLTFSEAVKTLADRAGITLPEISASEENKARQREKDRIMAVLKDAAFFYFNNLRSPSGKNGMDYFVKRGLKPEIMRSFGLGYAGKHNEVCAFLKEKGYTDSEINAAGLVYADEKRGIRDRFFNRVMFPIMDVGNHVIGFGGRVMGEGEPKYLNSPETAVFDKRRNLYGLNEARKSRKGYLIACEGYMDVISLHQAGFTEAVASLGTAFTEEHARILKRYTEDIRLTYDSDSAGVKAALRAIPILKSAGINSRIIHLEPYKDPDEFIKALGRDEFQKRIDSAEQSLFFEIHVLQRDHDLSDPGERTAFQQKMARRLSLVEDELERNNYTEALAAEYMMDSGMLKRAVESSRLIEPDPGEAGGIRSTGIKNDRKKSSGKNGLIEAEKLLLTFISDDPDRVYAAVKPYIEADDFSEGIMRICAGELFKQIEKKELNVGSIVGLFREPEEQRLAAAIFDTSLDTGLSNTEKEQALTDLVIRVKKESLKRQSHENEDDPISRTIREKKVLEKLTRVRISLQ
ncbi:MAG: DNA primase [Lachnospiraceae bacterium]|nr:DNA primase [Lachnospiraceae bacterium]